MAFGLDAGETSYWMATGSGIGWARMIWFVAEPLSNTSSQNSSKLEVLHVTKAVDKQGNRAAYFQVHNHGIDTTTYAIRWAVTDTFT